MFYDSNQVDNILNCKKCTGRLDEPKILPCGNSICSHCVSLIQLKKNKEFQCLVCQDKHEMPKNGLPLNILAAEMLSFKSVNVSRGNAFESLQETLGQLENNKSDLKYCINNRDDCIKEHCIELRSKVQLTTEQAVENINEFNEQVIHEINEYEQEMISFNKKNPKSLKCFETIERELETFQSKTNECLKLNNLNDESLNKIKQDAIILKEKTDFEIKNVKSTIFSGCLLTFESNKNKINRENLGQLIMKEVYNILNGKKFEELMKLCEFPVDQKWRLIYKASIDGFESSDFHTECDDMPNTLVVIKSKNGNIFGGYTEESWSNTDFLSPYIDKSDSNAFLFSLINKENRPLKMKCSSNQGGIRCNNTCGPIFGGKAGYSDIWIGNLSNLSPVNHSYLGHYYTHSDYKYGSNKACSLLAGSFRFEVSDIEVYTTN
jgi:hypothetical protein